MDEDKFIHSLFEVSRGNILKCPFKGELTVLHKQGNQVIVQTEKGSVVPVNPIGMIKLK